jgi:hypothetical protein
MTTDPICTDELADLTRRAARLGMTIKPVPQRLYLQLVRISDGFIWGSFFPDELARYLPRFEANLACVEGREPTEAEVNAADLEAIDYARR